MGENMREIKFRGYSTSLKKWLFGFVRKMPNFEIYFIDGEISNTVRKESIGQYTGLKDKNGKEVFEGDVVIAWSQGQKEICEVKWGQGRVGFFLYRSPNVVWHLSGGGFDYTFEMIEIIGNKYKNPELT